MIYLIATLGLTGMFLMGALLTVCRGFALQHSQPEPYEVRLWQQYSGASAPETQKAA